MERRPNYKFPSFLNLNFPYSFKDILLSACTSEQPECPNITLHYLYYITLYYIILLYITMVNCNLHCIEFYIYYLPCLCSTII